MIKTVLFCFLTLALNAQGVFQKKIPGLQNPEGLIYMPDGGYTLAGLKGNCIQIIRLDAMGNPSWMRQICPSNSGLDISIGRIELVADPLIPGAFLLVFRKGAFSSGPDNLLNVMKMDASGNLLWECQLRPEKRYGALAPGSQISITPSGTVWGTHSMGFTDLLPDFSQALVFKIDAAGQILMRRFYQTNVPARSNGILAASDQEIYVYGGLDMVNKDGLLMRLNGQGDVLWANRYEGLHFLRDGGRFSNGDLLLMAEHDHGYALTRIDPGGALRWAWQFSDSLSLFHCAVAADDGVVFAGKRPNSNFILGKILADTPTFAWAKNYEDCTRYFTYALCSAPDNGAVFTQSATSGTANARVVKIDENGKGSASCPVWEVPTVPLLSVQTSISALQFSQINTLKNDLEHIYTLKPGNFEVVDCCPGAYPEAGFLLPDSVCVASTINLVSLGDHCAETWHWETPGANKLEGDGPDLQGLNFSGPGKYVLRLTTTIGHCSAEFTDTIEVVEPPARSLFSTSDTTICPDAPLILAPESPQSGDMIWSDGSTASNLVLAPPLPGVYRLTVYQGLCAITDSIHVKIGNCGPTRVFVPNAFSPNEDGQNDLWEISFQYGVSPLTCQIFDRWGNECFVTETGTMPKWDGQWKGLPMPTGVYVWTFKFRNAEGKEAFLSGDLLLVR